MVRLQTTPTHRANAKARRRHSSSVTHLPWRLPGALPANLRVSKPLSEVIQPRNLVWMKPWSSYITNTTAFFTLGAEEIVYLNDLGVSGNVITAMMERDRTLKPPGPLPQPHRWFQMRPSNPSPPRQRM